MALFFSSVYRRSAMAMFFTSITTAAAFIVSATSPFLVVSAFGVFSGSHFFRLFSEHSFSSHVDIISWPRHIFCKLPGKQCTILFRGGLYHEEKKTQRILYFQKGQFLCKFRAQKGKHRKLEPKQDIFMSNWQVKVGYTSTEKHQNTWNPRIFSSFQGSW